MLQRIALVVTACAVVALSVSVAIQSTDAQTTQPSGTYEADLAHSSVYFRIEHAGMSLTYGRFNKIDGQFTLDGGDSSFSFMVAADSVDTANKKRDDHLRGPDFFNAKQYPAITFKSKSVKHSGKTYKVTGDLSMHGKTKEITIDVKLHGAGKAFGKQRAGVNAEFSIDRTDFGMTYGVDKGVVGKQVDMFISIEGVQN